MSLHFAFAAPVVLPCKTTQYEQPLISLRRKPIASASGPRSDKDHISWTRRAFLTSGATLAAGVALPPAQALRVPSNHDVLYDASSGSFIPPSSLETVLTRDRGSLYENIIIASEIHDNSRTHAAQLAVLDAVRRTSNGRPLVVGFEQFWRAHNPFLAQYARGKIGIEELLRVTQWGATWGYDPALYAPILRWCRVHRVTMVGLNVPRRLVSFVSQFGLQGLSPELRAFLPTDIDTSSEAHFQLFQRLLGMSQNTLVTRNADMRETVWKWFEAQVTWDEYMSETCSLAIKDNPGANLVALIGSGHVEGRVGFPNRIEKRMGERPYTIVPRPVNWVLEEGHAMPDIIRPEKNVADIVWYTNRTIDLV